MKNISLLILAIYSIISCYSQPIKNYYESGVAKYKSQDTLGALADYTQAIRIHPNLENAYYDRGFIKIELEDFRGAIADFNKAIKINPKDAECYLNRGSAKYNLHDFRGAIEDFSRAIYLNPVDPRAYYDRGTSSGLSRSAMGHLSSAAPLASSSSSTQDMQSDPCSHEQERAGAGTVVRIARVAT